MWLNCALQIIIVEGNGFSSVLQFLLRGLLTHVAFRRYHNQQPLSLRHLRAPWGNVDDFNYSQRRREGIPSRLSTLPGFLILGVHYKLFQIPCLQ